MSAKLAKLEKLKGLFSYEIAKLAKLGQTKLHATYVKQQNYGGVLPNCIVFG